MKPTTLVAGSIILMTAVAGCGPNDDAPITTLETVSGPTTAAPYVPPPLPQSCTDIVKHVRPGVTRDLAVVIDGQPEIGQAPEIGQVVCTMSATSPDGRRRVQISVDVRVMPPDLRYRGANYLGRWQRESVSAVIDSACDSLQTEAVGQPQYTMRCERYVAGPSVMIALAAAGTDGRVVGAQSRVFYGQAAEKDQARQYAEQVARSVIDAGQATR